MSIGVTGVSIAPELGLHFHEGSLSFFERCCFCCGSKEAVRLDIDDKLYIDHKLRVMRWQDKKDVCSNESTHARLKLIAIDRLHKVSATPFIDAQVAFEMSSIEWEDPQDIRASDIKRLSESIARIRESIVSNGSLI